MNESSSLARSRAGLVRLLEEHTSATEALASGPQGRSSEQRKIWIEQVRNAVAGRQAAVDQLADLDAKCASLGIPGADVRDALQRVINADRMLTERFMTELREIQSELQQVRTSRGALRAYGGLSDTPEPLFRRTF